MAQLLEKLLAQLLRPQVKVRASASTGTSFSPCLAQSARKPVFSQVVSERISNTGAAYLKSLAMNTLYPDHIYYGVGIEWAEAMEKEILENLSQLSCFELIPENFFHDRDAILKQIQRSEVPVLVHGVELSLGTDEPLKQKHFEQILRVAGEVNTINVSDHLCFTEAGGVEIGQLTPLPWTMESADVVCRKIDQIQKQLTVPFLIENITNRFVVPGTEFSETGFINRILDRTGCGLLLDLNNVHTNAVNFGFDPFDWINEINLGAVKTIHLAGGFYDDEGALIDSHSDAAPERVWELFRHVCERILPCSTIFEWTDDVRGLPALMNEVARAEQILLETRGMKMTRTRPQSAAGVGVGR